MVKGRGWSLVGGSSHWGQSLGAMACPGPFIYPLSLPPGCHDRNCSAPPFLPSHDGLTPLKEVSPYIVSLKYLITVMRKVTDAAVENSKQVNTFSMAPHSVWSSLNRQPVGSLWVSFLEPQPTEEVLNGRIIFGDDETTRRYFVYPESEQEVVWGQGN